MCNEAKANQKVYLQLCNEAINIANTRSEVKQKTGYTSLSLATGRRSCNEAKLKVYLSLLCNRSKTEAYRFSCATKQTMWLKCSEASQNAGCAS